MSERREIDSLGEVRVPADRYYGAQTARSLENFPIGTERFPREFLRALGVVKKAAALTNQELGVLEAGLAERIVQAADEVIEGRLDEHFPLSIWQTGSGTQTNMNANEVIANRAIELAGGELGSKSPVHPNDHVNLSQSSNDVFPTAMHVAAMERLRRRLVPVFESMGERLHERAAAHGKVVMVGRTHLMDAVPLTFAQMVGGWARQVAAAIERLASAEAGLLELALGGTAVGTGLNAPDQFGVRAVARIAALTGLPFRPASDRFEAISASDAVVFASGALAAAAGALSKIANDVRLLASGPRSGLGELSIPANEPGSSIMPGKVNPTQCEALTMVCAQVTGNDTAIRIGGAGGHLQLNACRPMMIHALLQSIRLLADAVESFTVRCIAGLTPESEAMRRHVEGSLMLVTALVPKVGYDAAARVAKKAHDEGTTLRESAIALGLVTAAEFDACVDPNRLTGPGENEGR